MEENRQNQAFHCTLFSVCILDATTISLVIAVVMSLEVGSMGKIKSNYHFLSLICSVSLQKRKLVRIKLARKSEVGCVVYDFPGLDAQTIDQNTICCYKPSCQDLGNPHSERKRLLDGQWLECKFTLSEADSEWLQLAMTKTETLFWIASIYIYSKTGLVAGQKWQCNVSFVGFYLKVGKSHSSVYSRTGNLI